MAKEAKTNAMRMLERAKVTYTSHEYPHEEGQAVDGANVARLTGQDPARVFKTLVTQGADRNYYVFVVPVLAELDLKKAAKAAGVKSVAMIHVADINKVTGYIRGGCSPVGMKKQFVTVYDESCLAQQTMLVSGGRIGTQIECAPADLIKVTRGRTAATGCSTGRRCGSPTATWRTWRSCGRRRRRGSRDSSWRRTSRGSARRRSSTR